MIIKVLGSAAGGGFPQWNCNCANCADVRRKLPGLLPRTQSSLAVSSNARDWVLLNASPDLRQQLAANPELSPSATAGARSSPIKAVVLTNGDIDHVAGLLNLREAQPFTLHASKRVLSALAANPVFNVLDPGLVARLPLGLDQVAVLSGAGAALGLTVEMFAVPGKIALYLEDAAAGAGLGTRPGDTVGVRIHEPATDRAFFYIPGCAAVDTTLAARLTGAELVLFDGTLFTDDEMITAGLSAKTGQRMGHISMSGPGGSMAAFTPLGVRRRVFVHMNNSNPVLREGSRARAAVEAGGWEVAFDGMEIRL